MSQNVEIEFKNLLTKDEFQKLMEYFHIESNDFISQDNHYFDTPDFSLKKKHSALRIRQKSGKWELTLKQPYGEDLLETNEPLQQKEAEILLQNGGITQPTLLHLLREMSINEQNLTYFGQLTTRRAEFAYKEGLLVLDHSFYLNKEDFEVEYEVDNRAVGKKVFEELLQKLEIPLRRTENKIKRFYRECLAQKHF